MEGLQICPSLVEITSVGNVSKNMNNEWNEVNYTEELKEKDQRNGPKSLNQSPQGGLEKISYMSSNGSSRNCYKILNKNLIGHVLGRQNGRSTLKFHVSTSVSFLKWLCHL